MLYRLNYIAVSRQLGTNVHNYLNVVNIMNDYFSKNIKYIRISNGLSFTKMSKILDKARSSVANYEDGSTEPAVSVIRRYVQYFDISYTDLFESDLEKRGVQVQPNDQSLSNEPVVSYKKKLDKSQLKFLKKISDSINDIKNGMKDIDKRLKVVEGKIKSK